MGSPIVVKLVSEKVFGRLTDLPVAVGQRSLQSRVDLWPVERGECEYGSAPHRGLVGRARQDRREPRRVADRAECSHGRLAHERVTVSGRQFDEVGDGRGIAAGYLATGPGGHLDDRRIAVGQQATQQWMGIGGQEGDRRDLGGARPNCGIAVGDRRREVRGGQRPEPRQCPEGRRTNRRVLVGESGSGGDFIALMARQRDRLTTGDVGRHASGSGHCTSWLKSASYGSDDSRGLEASSESEPPVSHMVSYRSSDGKQSYHQTDELSDAMQYVEHLRNAEGVEHARIFKLEELSFEYRPYYRVELASVLPPPPAPAESEWLSAKPDVAEMLEEVPAEAPAEDADPLAAAWSVSERSEPADGEHVGAGMGRKGLFGR